MGVMKTEKQRIKELEQENNSLKSRLTEQESTGSIAFVKLAENGIIDETTAAEHAAMFEEWRYEKNYAVGDLRVDGEKLYKCIQAHRSQTGWEPHNVPALWVCAGDPAEEYPAWSQPVGAHDAYDQGAKVAHNGKHWESTVGANVWEPGVYGWKEVE